MIQVLCVFEKLPYKVGIFHKKLAEFVRTFMGFFAVLIEFSLRHKVGIFPKKWFFA